MPLQTVLFLREYKKIVGINGLTAVSIIINQISNNLNTVHCLENNLKIDSLKTILKSLGINWSTQSTLSMTKCARNSKIILSFVRSQVYWRM